MRHQVHGRHLGRDTAHRLSLYRNLVTDLLRYERITTTEAKAKEIRPMAERIITLGRKGGLHERRQALRFVFDEDVVSKVFDEIGPRMRDRPGGYTRITALEPRKGDGARMASIELLGFVEAAPTPRPQRVTAAPRAAGPAAAAATAVAAAPSAVATTAVEAEAEETPADTGAESETTAIADETTVAEGPDSPTHEAPEASDSEPDGEGETRE